MSKNENRKPQCKLLAVVLKKNEEEEEEKKRRDYLKSVVRRNQQMPATVRSDCNDGDMFGSTPVSYTHLTLPTNAEV